MSRRKTANPSVQPAAIIRQPAATVQPEVVPRAAPLSLGEPSARVRPTSSEPAAAATPTPSISRCPPAAGSGARPSLISAGSASGQVSAMNGSSPRNTQRQPNSLAISALIAGPASPGATQAVDSTALILARRPSGRLRPIATYATAGTAPAPSPCSVRPAISTGIDGARPATVSPAPNRTIPHT